MWTGAKDALENGIANVAFLRTNIELITEFFAENEISEIWITFPDPQMKKSGKDSLQPVLWIYTGKYLNPTESFT